MYGNWQLGHMQLHLDVLKHNDFAEKMRAVDPNLTLIAVGNVGDWSQGMLRHCADRMGLISEHFYCGAMADLIEHMQQIPNNVHRIATANYAQTVNVIGCIKTTRTDASFDTTALPLMLYRKHFGAIPVDVAGDFQMLALDVAAAWTEKRDALTMAVVNPNPAEVTVGVDLEGADLQQDGRVWQIAAADPDAYNDAENQRVGIVEAPFHFDGRLRVPAFGITLHRLRTE